MCENNSKEVQSKLELQLHWHTALAGESCGSVDSSAFTFGSSRPASHATCEYRQYPLSETNR